MKKLYLIGLLAIAAALFLNACSKDGSVVATYSDGIKTYSIKVGDIKKDLLSYVSYNPSIISNSDWHKDFVFDRYIAREIVYQEKIKTDYTNSQDFKKDFDSEYQKNLLVLQFRKGQEILNNQAKNGKYEVVNPAHILILTSQFTNISRAVVSYTNINGKKQALTNWQQEQQKISDKDFAAILKTKELVALNIIENIKKANDKEKEFIKIASNMSEDYATSRVGGDIGFIPKGYMIKEYEDAAFAAKTKGLMEKPVLTSYGYYIIYIKSPVQQKSLGEIESASGKESFKRMESFFNNSFQDKIKKENIKEDFTVDYTNKMVTVNGKLYKPANLTDDLVLFEMFGQKKNWKDCKDIILLYVPDFNTNLTIESFMLQMQNYKNFVFMMEIAKKNNAEKTKSFADDLQQAKESLTKKLVVQTFEKELQAQVNAALTPQVIKEFYDKNKANYFNNVNGKKVQLSFKDAQSRISDELKGQYFREFYNQWKDGARTRTKVSFNDNGLKDLYGLETAEYQKVKGPQKK